MKRTIKSLLLLALFGMCFSLINCSEEDNPTISSSSLVGSWKLVTITDKEGGFTLNAGEPTEVEQGITITVTGSLILTETRYTFAQTMTASTEGFPPQTQTDNSTGTYSISGSKITTIEDGSEETITSSISKSGNRLTIDDEEVRMVFEKEDDNPVSSLSGTWNLVTLTDKEAGFTVNAGEPTEIEGVTITVTGSLILTETRYTFAQVMIASIAGFPTQTETESSTGTYSVSGSSLTTIEDGTGETNTSTITVSGNQLTIDDDEVRMVFEKQ